MFDSYGHDPLCCKQSEIFHLSPKPPKKSSQLMIYLRSTPAPRMPVTKWRFRSGFLTKNGLTFSLPYTDCVATQRLFIFIPIPGEMIQFDEHIFQMGWFKPPTSYQPTIILWDTCQLRFELMDVDKLLGLDIVRFPQWKSKGQKYTLSVPPFPPGKYSQKTMWLMIP